MSVKAELRKTIIAERKAIDNKQQISEDVFKLLSSSRLYVDADVVFCYASLDDEISTDLLMKKVLADGKTLALPYCVDDKGNMDFYYVESFDDLVSGMFGVREPNINKCELAECPENAIIIVPAMCFDEKGYRLGYGKGYYDRYLQNNTLISVGLCYNSLVKKEIPHDSFDIPVDYIVTESQILACDDGGKNGLFKQQ